MRVKGNARSFNQWGFFRSFNPMILRKANEKSCYTSRCLYPALIQRASDLQIC